MTTTAKTTRSGRKVSQPAKFADYVPVPVNSSTDKVHKEDKLWEVEDVLEVTTEEGGERMARVRWTGWEGPDSESWVSLGDNPELDQFMTDNRANPSSCTATRRRLENLVPPGVSGLDDDILIIRQAVFDALGGARYTPEGNTGFVKRVSVIVPFREAAWKRHFCPLLGHRSPKTTDTKVSVKELDLVLGEGWHYRTLHTSTMLFVRSSGLVRLRWEYKERPLYNHEACRRCHHDGLEEDRPMNCNYVVQFLPGPAYLTLSFTRLRVNQVARDAARLRRLADSATADQ